MLDLWNDQTPSGDHRAIHQCTRGHQCVSFVLFRISCYFANAHHTRLGLRKSFVLYQISCYFANAPHTHLGSRMSFFPFQISYHFANAHHTHLGSRNLIFLFQISHHFANALHTHLGSGRSFFQLLKCGYPPSFLYKPWWACVVPTCVSDRLIALASCQSGRPMFLIV